MARIRLFSSDLNGTLVDLNGTLVRQHTMSDTIRLYIGQEEYQQANKSEKTRLILEYTKTHLPNIKPIDIAHMGGTVSGGKGIADIAQSGGICITFNPDKALLDFIDSLDTPTRTTLL